MSHKVQSKKAQIAVKYVVNDEVKWSYHVTKKGRDLVKALETFRKSSNFRMMFCYEMSDDWKPSDLYAKRGKKVFYGDKRTYSLE